MLVLCNKCGLKDTDRKEMEFTLVGDKKKIRKYYHKGKCWESYLKEQAVKEADQPKKDALNETLKEIYGMKEIPNQAWSLLANLREGNPVFGNRQKMSKRYKEGYDYILIKETFEYCSETIEYANRTKKFDGFMGAFKYAMAIIIDKIYVVEQRREDRERQQRMIETQIKQDQASNQEFQTSFKKKSKSNTDITDFLD